MSEERRRRAQVWKGDRWSFDIVVALVAEWAPDTIEYEGDYYDTQQEALNAACEWLKRKAGR